MTATSTCAASIETSKNAACGREEGAVRVGRSSAERRVVAPWAGAGAGRTADRATLPPSRLRVDSSWTAVPRAAAKALGTLANAAGVPFIAASAAPVSCRVACITRKPGFKLKRQVATQKRQVAPRTSFLRAVTKRVGAHIHRGRGASRLAVGVHVRRHVGALAVGRHSAAGAGLALMRSVGSGLRAGMQGALRGGGLHRYATEKRRARQARSLSRGAARGSEHTTLHASAVLSRPHYTKQRWAWQGGGRGKGTRPLGVISRRSASAVTDGGDVVCRRCTSWP